MQVDENKLFKPLQNNSLIINICYFLLEHHITFILRLYVRVLYLEMISRIMYVYAFIFQIFILSNCGKDCLSNNKINIKTGIPNSP